MIYLTLFYEFLLIGLFTFGGGYAMIPLIQEKVIGHAWLTETEFMSMIAIAESTPGPIAINMATFVGFKAAGVFGALLSTIGVILPSFIIILLIATVLTKIIDRPIVKQVLHGIQGVVIGLIFATAFYFLYQNIFSLDSHNLPIEFLYKALIIFGVVVITALIYKLIRKKNISPYLILIEGGLLGFIIYYAIPLIF